MTKIILQQSLFLPQSSQSFADSLTNLTKTKLSELCVNLSALCGKIFRVKTHQQNENIQIRI